MKRGSSVHDVRSGQRSAGRLPLPIIPADALQQGRVEGGIARTTVQRGRLVQLGALPVRGRVVVVAPNALRHLLQVLTAGLAAAVVPDAASRRRCTSHDGRQQN